MSITKKIRRIFSKTYAIAEKNVRVQYRFKYKAILRYISPIMTILIPIIILDRFFEYQSSLGPWTSENFMVFLFIGYIVMLMRSMISYIPDQLMREKYWKTLPALITSPFNRFYLLFGFIISEFIGIIVPLVIYFVLILIFFPLSLLTLIIIVLMFLGLGIVFSGVGLLIGVFAISNENLWSVFDFGIRIIFWFSCVTFPFQMFPGPIQIIINLNPIYYLIDIIRLTWIENNILITAISHPREISIFIISLAIFPIVCVYFFNLIFKKLGISGY